MKRVVNFMLKKCKDKFNHVPLEAKASVAYTVCSILQKFISLLTLPFFTRILTTEQYGQVTVYSSWVSLLGIFLTLNLAYGSFSTAMVKFADRRNAYISSLHGICITLSAIFLIIYLPFQGLWNGFFELPTSMVLFMVVEIFASTMIQFWMGKQRFEYKYKGVVGLTLLMAVLSPALSFLLIFLAKEKGYAKIIGGALPSIVIGIGLFIYNLIRRKNLYINEFWKYALGFNLPLIVYYLSQMIFNQSDRIMISHMTGTSNAALYGLAYNIAIVLNFVLNAVNNSYVPWLYQHIKDNRFQENKKVSAGIAILMSVLFCGIIWFAPEIVLILGGEKYQSAVWVIYPVVISQLLLLYSQFSINIMFYFEEKKRLVFSSIGAAMLNLVLNYIFIKLFGFVAAGYTTLASYIVFSLANALSLRKMLITRKIRMDAYNIKWLILIFITLCALGIVGMLLYLYLIVRITCVVVVAIILLVQRKRMISFFSVLKRKT